MSKYKDLALNTVVYSISGFISNSIGFLLLPLYTIFISKESMGYIDLIMNTVILLIPVFTLSVTDAVMRYCLDKDNNTDDARTKYFTTGMVISVCGIILMIILFRLVHPKNDGIDLQSLLS